jgi:hypothetical protein
MSWNDNVSGGTGPPVLETRDDAGRVVLTLAFPASAALTESFDVASVRHTALDGTLLDTPRGYRYRARVAMPSLAVATWRGLTAALALWRAGGRLRFYPHDDCERIYYDVVPAADFAFPYVSGKYLGYAGTLELAGTELLPFIPATWDWAYYCAAAEDGYDPDEITYFTAAGEPDYDDAEISYFGSAEARG